MKGPTELMIAIVLLTAISLGGVGLCLVVLTLFGSADQPVALAAEMIVFVALMCWAVSRSGSLLERFLTWLHDPHR